MFDTFQKHHNSIVVLNPGTVLGLLWVVQNDYEGVVGYTFPTSIYLLDSASR